MADMGMTPAEPAFIHPSPPSHLAVQSDGRIIGYVAAALAPLIVQRLHSIKAAALALQEGSTSSGNLPTLQVFFSPYISLPIKHGAIDDNLPLQAVTWNASCDIQAPKLCFSAVSVSICLQNTSSKLQGAFEVRVGSLPFSFFQTSFNPICACAGA